MSFKKRVCPTSQICKWGTLMPSKQHMPQLFLKLLWTRTWGQYEIKSTNYISYSQLIHWVQGSQATQEVLHGCVSGSCDSLRDVCREHVTHREQTFDSAHEDATPGHATTHQSTSQVALASISATSTLTCAGPSPGLSFLCLGFFMYSNTPCPSTSLPFPLPNPSFLFSNYSQWSKKNKMK